MSAAAVDFPHVAAPNADAEPDVSAARAALDAAPMPEGSDVAAAVDIPAPTREEPAREKRSEPTPAKRGRGRPPGATPDGFKTARSKDALKRAVADRDRQIEELRAQLATYTGEGGEGEGLEDLEETAAELLDGIFDTVAELRGAEHWKLPAARRDRIAKPLARWAEPYMREQVKNAPLALALFGLGMHSLRAYQHDMATAGAPANGTR